MNQVSGIDKTRTWHDNCLNGIVGPRYALEPAEGEYRIKRKNRREKTQTLHAVYFWYDRTAEGAPMRCHVDGKDVSKEAALGIWEYCGAKNCISGDVYWAFLETGKWIDIDADAVLPASNRDVTSADNSPPKTLSADDHAEGIDAAIGAALKKVTTETEAAQALGSKNRLAELRLAADKAGKALYQPPYQEYQRLYGEWNPPVKRAEAKEKELNTIILTFRESERRRIAAEQALADTKQREIEEANERAAQRAISAGEQEPPPIVEEIEQPAPLAPVAPTYGSRKLKEEVKTFLDNVEDWDAVYKYFKNTTEVKTVLMVLATAAIRAGDSIPGTTTREGLI